MSLATAAGINRDAAFRSKKKWDAARFGRLLSPPVDRNAINETDEYHRTPLLMAVSLGARYLRVAGA